MPIHFHDVDISAEISDLKSVLIVPCVMCPAVTVAIRERKPLIRFFRSPFKSAPFERYVKSLQKRLTEQGVKNDVFKSRLYQNWFLCMWSAKRRNKLSEHAKDYEAIIVLGCASAAETVRDAVNSTDCKIIESMEVRGLTNAKLKFGFPDKVSFEGDKIVPMPK